MTPRERLAEIRRDMVARGLARVMPSIAELAEIVETLLPAERTPVGAITLPAAFTDPDGDSVRVDSCPHVDRAIRLYWHQGAVDIEPHEVDRFVAAVLKAAGR